MTFTQWYYEHKDEIRPEDIMAWCAEAWMAGFDEATKQAELLNQGKTK